ncbi:hypothetical protein RJT34_33106 [Clitoria ternatea]|uniref:Uncharacterized protein n=1 Tax=Clitoria ternatea TaxID=43366 RepID=A0AAN9EZI4_CLITE
MFVSLFCTSSAIQSVELGYYSFARTIGWCKLLLCSFPWSYVCHLQRHADIVTLNYPNDNNIFHSNENSFYLFMVYCKSLPSSSPMKNDLHPIAWTLS